MNDIIGKIDFWILLTPYDEFSDDRNLMEANLEYPTVAQPLFDSYQILNMRDECYILNMCNYPNVLDLNEKLGGMEDIQINMFPSSIDVPPKIAFTRKETNKLALALHNKIRPRLHLAEDYDEETGIYWQAPEKISNMDKY